ncbi:MAG: NAD(P)H-hydrate epimerase [Trueperaceae bacterium]|nr:NAD(P)H-hydrate epimerase [Trueperaceae bacterium]
MTIAVNRTLGVGGRSTPRFDTAYGEVVPAVLVAQMRQLEQRWMIERQGTPDHLAALAGGRLAAVVAGRQTAGPLRVAVAAGGGRNGAAGLHAARALAQMGHAVTVVPVAAGPFGARAITASAPLRGAFVQVADARHRAAALGEADVVVDAMVGCGLQGGARVALADAIRDVNRLARWIVAADLPSGMDADTGLVWGPVVRPAVVVVFGLPKPGLAQAAAYGSDLLLADLRFPAAAIRALGLGYGDPFRNGPVVALRCMS